MAADLKSLSLNPQAQSLPDFLEVAPENWIGAGGRIGKQFRFFAERYPIALHGLSLNIGGLDALDIELIKAIKAFIKEFNCPLYSEHLSYCGDRGHLYDLMPIPFTFEAVQHVAERVRQVQDILEQPLVLENVSYYARPADDLSEVEFINAVLAESGAELLLDVNNIYVNSINHRYCPDEFLTALDCSRARLIHIAGHFDEADDLKVDTHGADIIDPVWELLQAAYAKCGVLPTLLERDFNIPPIAELMAEVDRVRSYQQRALALGLSAEIVV